MAVHFDEAGADEAAATRDDLHPVPGDQTLQPLIQPADDGVLVLMDTADVDPVEADRDPELRGAAGAVCDLGRMQQGLGGDGARCRQVPPSLSDSTRITDSPSSEAGIAAE